MTYLFSDERVWLLQPRVESSLFIYPIHRSLNEKLSINIKSRNETEKVFVESVVVSTLRIDFRYFGDPLTSNSFY